MESLNRELPTKKKSFDKILQDNTLHYASNGLSDLLKTSEAKDYQQEVLEVKKNLELKNQALELKYKKKLVQVYGLAVALVLSIIAWPIYFSLSGPGEIAPVKKSLALVLTQARINLRERPDIKSKSLGLVPAGTVLKKWGQNGDWIEVEFKNFRGHLNRGKLSEMEFSLL